MNTNTINTLPEYVKMYGDLCDAKFNDIIPITIHSEIRRPSGWKTVSMPIKKFVAHLSQHEVGSKKGTCFIPGDLEGQRRRGVKMKSLSCMAFDIDGAMTIESAVDQVQKKGLAASMYSTHSHNTKSSTVVDVEGLVETFGDEYSDADIIQFCRETSRDIDSTVFDNSTVEKIENADHTQTVIVHHSPIPKFRVVLFLAKPFVIAEQGSSLFEAKQIWKGKYAAVGEMLGFGYDEACTDLARALYMPRHAHGADHEVRIIDGDFLNLDSFKYVPKVRKSQTRRAKINHSCDEKHVPFLMKFLMKHAANFDAETFFEVYGEQRLERANGDGWHYECPNDAAHSNAGDSTDNAFFVSSPGNNEEYGTFTAHCNHGHCAGLDRADFLNMVIKQYGLKWDDLMEYCQSNTVDSLEELRTLSNRKTMENDDE